MMTARTQRTPAGKTGEPPTDHDKSASPSSKPRAALAVNPDAYNGKGPFEIGQVRAAVRHYLNRGWISTPCIPSTKRPRLSKWEKRGLKAEEIDTLFNEADSDRNKEGDSIGLVLGQMSGGLVVVDLDHVDPKIAAFLLPDSALVDGREGNPTSHWFYRVPEGLRKQTFTHPDRDKGKIIELLGDGEQVIVPPSTHPSGVHRVWEKYGEPSEQDAPELVEVCARIAAYQVIADLWPDAGRHDLALPLAGGLLRAGIDDGEVEWFLNYLCKSTVKDHREIEHIVQSTAQKLEEGDARVSGWPMFAAMLGGGSLQRCLDAVLGWLNVADVDLTDPRPRVPVFGTSHSTAKRVWPVVEEANDPPVLFRRGKRFLRTRPHDDSGGVTGVTAEELDYNGFKFQLSEVVCLTKQDDKGKHRAVDPPKGIVDDMLANPNPPVPVLNRIVSVPVFAPDGTLQVEPGYHPAARVYYQPAPGLDVPAVPLSPTDEDIQQARELLLELLQDFPFVDEADRTHAVALALLPFARDLINGPTPWHMISASREGTGKGLLAQVLSMIFEGGNGASGQPMSQSDEEMRKTILSSLMQSSTFILWDNISGLVDSASLAAALTAIDYMDRKLGVSEMVPIRVRSVWIGTANNPAMSGEITRRSIRIRIEAKEQRPDERKDYLHPNLAQWVGENRSRLVGACLTLVQAWVAAGKPTGDYTMGSYADWAGVMGGILDTAGLSGLLDNVQEFRSEAHGQGTAWESFTEGWWDEFGPHPKTAGELLQRAREADVELPLTTQEHPAQKLGYLLSGQIGNVWGDYVVRLGAKRRGKGKSYVLVSRSGAKWEKSERPTGDQPQAFDGQRGSAAR